MEDEFPSSEYFDSSELISSGNIPDLGKKITIEIENNSRELLKNVTVMKSDAATVCVPQIELEVSQIYTY
jgi:hypothetical protein